MEGMKTWQPLIVRDSREGKAAARALISSERTYVLRSTILFTLVHASVEPRLLDLMLDLKVKREENLQRRGN